MASRTSSSQTKSTIEICGRGRRRRGVWAAGRWELRRAGCAVRRRKRSTTSAATPAPEPRLAAPVVATPRALRYRSTAVPIRDRVARRRWYRRLPAVRRNLERLLRRAHRIGQPLDVDQVLRADVVAGDVAGHRAAAQRHRRKHVRRDAGRALRRRRVHQHAKRRHAHARTRGSARRPCE